MWTWRPYRSGKRVLPVVYLAVAAAACLGFPAASPGVIVVEDFDDGTIDPNFTLDVRLYSTVSLVGGKMWVEKEAGMNAGKVRLSSDFDLLGDFTVSVLAHRETLTDNAEMGLGVSFGGGFADVYYFHNGRVNSNITLPTKTFNFAADTSTPALFQIERIGNRITTRYDPGTGLTKLLSKTDPTLGGPVSVGVFLLNAYSNKKLHKGWFDDLTIEAEAFDGYEPPEVIPEPATLAIWSLLSVFGYFALVRRKRKQ